LRPEKVSNVMIGNRCSQNTERNGQLCSHAQHRSKSKPSYVPPQASVTFLIKLATSVARGGTEL
jgi:hypothetical protein